MRALVIEPDAHERQRLCQFLRNEGWHLTEVESADEAYSVAAGQDWGLVICDVNLSAAAVVGQMGKGLLDILTDATGGMGEVVLSAAPGQSLSAFEAVLNGAAADVILKPYRIDAVRETAARARRRWEAAEEVETHETLLTPSRMEDAGEHQLVGESTAVVGLYKALARAVRGSWPAGERHEANRIQTFLVTGETGTGKELVARLIHRHSPFKRGTFVAVNCGNLSPELADAELFGSAPGAYTGATSGGRAGLWELASGGTLFLDEITEAPAGVLPKLLRVLQDGQVRRLGSSRWAKVSTQVVAATNRNILTEVKEGRFREDLYHRLSLHTLRLPPLRERLEDVPLLAAHFAGLYSGGTVRLSRDAVELLVRFSQEYPWPGNVRELGNVVRRAVTASPVRTISAIDLAANLPVKAERLYFTETGTICPPKGEMAKLYPTDGLVGGLEERVHQFKQHVVRQTLTEYDGNVTRAARALKISRPSLYRLLKNLENL